MLYNVFAPAMQGMQAMQNMGNQISSGFALANALSSANARAQYGPASDLQQEQLRQQGQTERLNAILPLLLQSFGGGGGAGGFTTNYGASATYNTNPQEQQSQSRIDLNRELYEQRARDGITGGPGGGLQYPQQPAQPSAPGQTHGMPNPGNIPQGVFDPPPRPQQQPRYDPRVLDPRVISGRR